MCVDWSGCDAKWALGKQDVLSGAWAAPSWRVAKRQVREKKINKHTVYIQIAVHESTLRTRNQTAVLSLVHTTEQNTRQLPAAR